ncbi:MULTISPECIES: SRPBCC family protein [Streptomyces]|uniref:SRPBCC family protein n=1 Tax=Streptomyces yunnanensis TaxID=156453 RepID=A0ABY8AKI4_9ACTN|nr:MULTISPECIES: SRPBCC family protein [Streptomyces]WEB45151.1 SRPBCC family protein [Streptomyces yunnanensis]
MKSVTVSIDVPQTPAQVYDFLDVMAHHERFTDHYLTDWRYDGPGRGIGSRATVTAALGGVKSDVIIEVVEAEAPRRIVERNISAAGRRLAHGTYTIEPLSTGGSRISFTYAWTRAPLAERLLAPAVRATMRRANHTVMRRLAAELARHVSAASC